MNDRTRSLEERGYPITDAPTPGGLYSPAMVHNGVVYLSGSIPVREGEIEFRGKVPSCVTVEDARRAAELCAANLLRVFVRDVAPLGSIEQVLKVTGFVNSDPDFLEPQIVVNGASQLLIDVLGDAGHHARSAVGMATLPLGVCVEVEMIVAVK